MLALTFQTCLETLRPGKDGSYATCQYDLAGSAAMGLDVTIPAPAGIPTVDLIAISALAPVSSHTTIEFTGNGKAIRMGTIYCC